MLLATLAVGGCDIRDERVRPAGEAGGWPEPRTNAAAAPAAGPEYVEGYEAAARRAHADGRPLVLVFGAAWCRWSGELSRGPLADPDLVAAMRRCVCGRIDADRDRETCRGHGVTAYPTVIILDAEGRERFRAAGAGAATGLAAALAGLEAAETTGRRIAGEDPGITR